MIQTQNLGYKISGKQLLTDISVQFKENEISLIIGSNGAGKSTLINLLSNQLMPSSGSVTYSDTPASNRAEISKVRAVLSQQIDMAFPLSVKEIVMMGRYPHFAHRPKLSDEKICSEAMQFFDVSSMSERNYLTLSGGEKQRVHFARVAAQIWPENNHQKTKYLLLDEPLTYLDIYFQFNFMNQIKELMQRQKMLVVGVVHDLNLAYQHANQVVLLENGKVLESGSPQAVFKKETIQKAFRLSPTFFTDESGKAHLSF